jgi:Xaa-Pro aminopeptidase
MHRLLKLAGIRKLMAENGVDALIVPASDPHQNEYIPACWQFRSWISGFTGSAGTIVIMKDTAGLWTDSRYFLQAEKQLEGSSIELFRLTIPHTPEHVPWMAANLPAGSSVGIDDRFFSAGMVAYLKGELETAGLRLKTGSDFLTPVWTERPPLPPDPVFEHEVSFSGKSRQEKIGMVRALMADQGADYHLVTALDDIAWLLNLRGSDVSFCPFFISYCVVSKNDVHLFILPEKVSPFIAEKLLADGVLIEPYEATEAFLESLPAGSAILYAHDRANNSVVKAIPAQIRHIHGTSIPATLKAVKNPVELAGLRKVMVKDGIAWVKTLSWISRCMAAGKTESEWTVAAKIAAFRAEQPEYRGESFHPISSYGWHGAVVHYSVTPGESLDLKPEGIFLLDSGGHYSDGTTDTTRTIALSPPDGRQKSDFTRALKGTLGVSMLRFPKGTKGFQMDILARKSLWENGLNYGHGTGHGVGFFLSVHEGPQSIGTSAGGSMNTMLEPGMVTTVEPAIYREGAYGMRTENMTLIVEDMVNEYGVFYKFETLTLAPIDRNLIERNLLTADEIDWLNQYHKRVYSELQGGLDPDEREWLAKAVEPL